MATTKTKRQISEDSKNVDNNVDKSVDNNGLMSQCIEWILSKFRNIIGVEFAEFGGMRRLSKMNLVDPTFIPSMLVDMQDRVHATLVRQLRQAITGDPEKRIRDSLSESHVKTRVQQVDAASFTLGVAVSYLIEWIILRRPTLFPTFFYILMAILLVNRFFTYRSTKEHYYMLDFCYALNLSTWLQTLTCDANDDANQFCVSWYKANFALSHGPIALAIIGWKNSLVFHSADKVTSFAIHIMPAMFHYLLRWEPGMNGAVINDVTGLTFTDVFLHPLLIYLAWQIFYLIVQFTHIDRDPTLVTSLRFLVGTDSGKPATKWGYVIFKKLGFLAEGETMDPFCKKTTLLFAGFQLVYVIVCLAPVPILYANQTANEIFILSLILIGIWNGGSYYIQIFSQRYNDKFEKGSNHDKFY